MTLEFTTVVMTYNLWSRQCWPDREPALRAFLDRRQPDVLAVQELRPETCRAIDSTLIRHARVADEFAGWSDEGNIWWRRDLYRLLDHGAEDIGLGKELRRLFWVRLQPPGDAPAVIVSTAHYTWPGASAESATGMNPRIGEALRTVEALDRLAAQGPCLFVGDLNDHYHPVRILHEAGFMDAFGALGTTSPATAPVVPLTRPGHHPRALDVPKVIDYQFFRGPIQVRCAEVPDFFVEHVAPSDHRPVVATYALRGQP